MHARILVAVALSAALAPLAGCMGGQGTGTFTLVVTDEPNDIGDFASLLVSVNAIVLTNKDGETREYLPASEDRKFDLTQLQAGNVTTLFSDPVAVGNYTRLELEIAQASGFIKAENPTPENQGTAVEVGVPSGRLFLNTAFEIAEGQETAFLFDITVHKTGNGEYQLKPNADGSRVLKGDEHVPGKRR